MRSWITTPDNLHETAAYHRWIRDRTPSRRLPGQACHRAFATRRPAEPAPCGSRRREPPPFGGFVKKELDCLILCWGALNCLLVRRSITGRRTGRQRDGRQSPAEVAGMITGAEQRDQGEQEDDQRAGHPAEKAGDE